MLNLPSDMALSMYDKRITAGRQAGIHMDVCTVVLNLIWRYY